MVGNASDEEKQLGCDLVLLISLHFVLVLHLLVLCSGLVQAVRRCMQLATSACVPYCMTS